MKRILAILALLGLSSLALAQSTTVSATVVDGSSQVWQNGTISYTFKGNGSFYGQYQWNGADLPSQYLTPTIVQLDSSGVGSFTIPSSTAIYPAGSTWTITTCPNATANCTTVNLTITGSSQDISSLLGIGILTIPIQTIPRAYNDNEILTSILQGGLYYNTSSALTGLRYWDGSRFSPVGGGTSGISNFNFTVPSPFSATGSPCIVTGCTVGFTIPNQSQNTVYAGPISGSGQPSFRLLTTGDIPSGLPYIPSSTTLYYQHIQNNSVGQAQEPATNFSSAFATTDNANVATNVDLARSGVTAGTYTCPSSLGIANTGIVTSAVNGVCPGSSVQTDETGSRSWGTSFQNTTGSMLIISGYTTTPGGSSTGTITCMSGPSSPSLEVWGNEYTATVNNAPVAFFCIVPNTYFYSISVSGDIASTPSKWIETTVN